MSVYQLKVVLRGISPMIWRQLLVGDDTTIAELHNIIQVAMGWENCHLHRFRIHGKDYGVAYAGGIGFPDDPHQIKLSQFLLHPGERFLYEYDFSDLWQHDIRLEAILPFSPKHPPPVCIGGKHTCPPEDCGGPWAYIEQRQERSSLVAIEDLHTLGVAIQRIIVDQELSVLKTGDERDKLEMALEQVRERERFNPDLFNRRRVKTQLRKLGQNLRGNHEVQNPGNRCH